MLEEFDTDRVWSVAELTREVRGCLEASFHTVWVRGEVSNLRVQPSGHCYFTLKDEASLLRVVLFRGDASRLEVLPEEGGEFAVFGELTVYEPRGEYQLRARHLLGVGSGGLRREFERLKRKLLEEGLFDAERKRALPDAPCRVAVVTSPTGAAFQDFISILRRRDWRGEVLLFPSKVQGAEAPGELLAALLAAQAFPEVDLVVLGRGGGSAEDLWAFNDEKLVRAVAGCSLPIISAVGHQVDFALTDFAADFRAETPSAAAERISSSFLEQRDRLEVMEEDLFALLRNRLDGAASRLELSEARLRGHSPKALVENAHQRLDEWEERAGSVARERLSGWFLWLDSLELRLEGNSLAGTLKRGFSLLRDVEGKPVGKKADLKRGQSVSATFADGEATLWVEDA